MLAVLAPAHRQTDVAHEPAYVRYGSVLWRSETPAFPGLSASSAWSSQLAGCRKARKPLEL